MIEGGIVAIQEESVAHNLFSFNPYSGVTMGIRPVIDQFDMMKRTLRPPHVACGNAFVSINNRWDPELREGLLLDATLRLISPAERRPFEVLDVRPAQATHLYLIVEPNRSGPGVKTKVTADMVNAIAQVEVGDGVRIVLSDVRSGQTFLEFHKDNGVAFVWSPDGLIYRFCREGAHIVHRPLTAVVMADLRIAQFRERVKSLDRSQPDQLRRYHGVVFGAIRLLRFTRDPEARDVLVEFLIEQIGPNLTDRIREEIRLILLDQGHPNACMFLSLEFVSTTEPVRCGARRKPTAKRVARSNKDREERMLRRGPASGGKQSPKTNAKGKGK